MLGVLFLFCDGCSGHGFSSSELHDHMYNDCMKADIAFLSGQDSVVYYGDNLVKTVAPRSEHLTLSLFSLIQLKGIHAERGESQPIPLISFSSPCMWRLESICSKILPDNFIASVPCYWLTKTHVFLIVLIGRAQLQGAPVVSL